MDIVQELIKSCLTLSKLDAHNTIKLFYEIDNNQSIDNKISINSCDREVIFYKNHFQLMMQQAPLFQETILDICMSRDKDLKLEAIDDSLSKLFLSAWCIGRLENKDFARVVEWSPINTGKYIKQILWSNTIEISYERVHKIKTLFPEILDFKQSI